MKPINQKERRISIWAFIGLFVAAALPLILAVYFFTRTDTVELSYLRKSYQIQTDQKRVSQNYRQMLQEVDLAVNALAEQATLQEDIKRFNSGELGVKLRTLKTAVDKFDPQPGKADSLYRKTAEHLHVFGTSTRKLIEGFEAEVNRMSSQVEMLTQANDLLKQQIRD